MQVQYWYSIHTLTTMSPWNSGVSKRGRVLHKQHLVARFATVKRMILLRSHILSGPTSLLKPLKMGSHCLYNSDTLYENRIRGFNLQSAGASYFFPLFFFLSTLAKRLAQQNVKLVQYTLTLPVWSMNYKNITV